MGSAEPMGSVKQDQGIHDASFKSNIKSEQRQSLQMMVDTGKRDNNKTKMQKICKKKKLIQKKHSNWKAKIYLFMSFS